MERSLLDNGLELLVIPNHTAPLITALVAIRAGSSVEDSSLNGYSHLFEHMIFQGSSAVPDSSEFRRQLQGLGAYSNATTDVDNLTYFFTAPSASADAALALMAGALKAPTLDEQSLTNERKVVLAEVDLNESRPDFLSYRAGLSALFGEYSPRMEPLGSRQVIMDVSRDELLQMHAKYYVPNNALLVLSGDLTSEQGKELAERHFADWPRGDDPQLDTPRATPLDAPSYQVLTAEVSQTTIELWWQGPSSDADPRGALAGELLAGVTSQSDHPFRSLVGPDLAYSADLSVDTRRHAGSVTVSLIVPPGRERAVLSELRAVLDRLAEPGDVSAAQLASAQADIFNSFVWTATDPAQLPFAIGQQYGVRDSASYFNFTSELYTVGTAALRRFASMYIRTKPKVVVLTSPAGNLLRQRIDAGWLEREAGR